ncbi:uncharacterized protein LOC129615479 [Condylostylus longicornis]|uniref:uncharacterized protein LOC129615479 n=1 Tax=Condylostylus longicornis TaxID=2530218 RepID=UPI00244E277C|nr:uncharacterized protein LOC129615479 [Condylostylus longicornis]
MYSTKSLIFYISFFILIGFFVSNVLTFQCYKCTTEETPSCHEEKFDPKETPIVDCSKEEPKKNSTGCKKWLRRTDKVWIRECIYDIDSRDTSKICGDVAWDWKTFTIRGANYEVCTTCSNNLCNSNDKTYYKKLFN